MLWQLPMATTYGNNNVFGDVNLSYPLMGYMHNPELIHPTKKDAKTVPADISNSLHKPTVSNVINSILDNAAVAPPVAPPVAVN